MPLHGVVDGIVVVDGVDVATEVGVGVVAVVVGLMHTVILVFWTFTSVEVSDTTVTAIVLTSVKSLPGGIRLSNVPSSTSVN